MSSFAFTGLYFGRLSCHVTLESGGLRQKVRCGCGLVLNSNYAEQKPKIGLVFYGIPRSGRTTYPAIYNKIIAPASELGDVEIRYHFFDQNKVINTRSGENCSLLRADYEPFFIPR